jgi:hypothetical protein
VAKSLHLRQPPSLKLFERLAPQLRSPLSLGRHWNLSRNCYLPASIELDHESKLNMSGFSGVMKGGWHPKGKDGGKESWRGDFKGINQVVSDVPKAVGRQILIEADVPLSS